MKTRLIGHGVTSQHKIGGSSRCYGDGRVRKAVPLRLCATGLRDLTAEVLDALFRRRSVRTYESNI